MKLKMRSFTYLLRKLGGLIRSFIRIRIILRIGLIQSEGPNETVVMITIKELIVEELRENFGVGIGII